MNETERNLQKIQKIDSAIQKIGRVSNFENTPHLNRQKERLVEFSGIERSRQASVFGRRMSQIKERLHTRATPFLVSERESVRRELLPVRPKVEEVPAIVERISENLWENLSFLDKANLAEAFFRDSVGMKAEVDKTIKHLVEFKKGNVSSPQARHILGEADPDLKKGLALEKLRHLVSLSIVEPQHPTVRIMGMGKELNDLIMLLGGGNQGREMLSQAINSLDEVARAILLSKMSMTKRFEILKIGADHVNEREMAFFLNTAIYQYSRDGDAGDLEEIFLTAMERDLSTEQFSASRIVEAILQHYPNGASYIFRKLREAARQLDFEGHLQDFFLSHPATLKLAYIIEGEEEERDMLPRNRRF